MLFNLVLEKVVWEINVAEGITLGEPTIEFLAYADGIALFGNDVDIIQRSGKNLIIR